MREDSLIREALRWTAGIVEVIGNLIKSAAWANVRAS